MKNAVDNQPATQVVAIPTTTIRTDAHGRRLGGAFVLVQLPDGSLGTLEGCRTYDRQQTCPYYAKD